MQNTNFPDNSPERGNPSTSNTNDPIERRTTNDEAPLSKRTAGRALATAIPPTSKQFLVEVVNKISTPRGMTIFPGDHVLIDPDVQPREGDLAIVEGDLIPWTGQQDVQGVAIGVSKRA